MRDIIQTPRLTLRPLVLSDAANFSLYANDLEISRMTGSIPHPFPPMWAEFKIMHMSSKFQRKVAFPYAITERQGEDATASPDTQNMIGIMDLFRRDIDEPLQTGLEIGYWIGRPFWGRGYATEAALAIIAEARDSLHVTQIKAGVFADNPASQKVLKNIGFKEDGPATDMYFSIARQKKALSLDMTLDLTDM